MKPWLLFLCSIAPAFHTLNAAERPDEGYVERTLDLPTTITVVDAKTYAPIPQVKVTYIPRMKPKRPEYDDFGREIVPDLGLGGDMNGVTDEKGQVNFKIKYEVETLSDGYLVILGRCVAMREGYTEGSGGKNVVEIKDEYQTIRIRVKIAKLQSETP